MPKHIAGTVPGTEDLMLMLRFLVRSKLDLSGYVRSV